MSLVQRRNALSGCLGNLQSSSTNDVGVVSVIKEQMSLRLRDLSDDSGQESSAFGLLRGNQMLRGCFEGLPTAKLEGVDGFEPRKKLS